MVEQERLEGRVAPNPEEEFRVLETTLAKLGVDTTFDKLNLAADKFILAVKKFGEDTIFDGHLKHPFAGPHFAQLLNSIAPFDDQYLANIIADVDLPVRAQADYKRGLDRATSEAIRLHERHLSDPRVRLPYMRFAEDHVENWLGALRSHTGMQVFNQLQRIRFINNKEEVASSLFLEWQQIFANIRDEKNEMRIAQIGYTAFGADQSTGGRLWNRFFNLSSEERAERINSFFNQLSIQGKQEFAISHTLGIRNKILVDLETMQVLDNLSNLSFLSSTVEFIDTECVEIRDAKDGYSIKVVPSKALEGVDGNWKIIECQLPEDYEESSLYPRIAWRNDADGNRSFLTQQEAKPLTRELGLPKREQGDTKLGEITVASFAHNIIKGWQAKMKLAPLEGVKSFRGNDFEQPMRGGQMPAWVGVEQHKAELLRSETSPLAIMEKGTGLAT